MTRFRVKIEEYKEPPEPASGGYTQYWHEIYEQQLMNLSIEDVVKFLNSTLAKVVEKE